MVYWSDGDQINVNGQISYPLEISGTEPVSDAEFLLPKQEPPYSVIYPASCVVTEAEYDSDGTIAVELPSVQEYVEGTFATNTAVMCAYAKPGESIVLKNICAAIRVNIKGTGTVKDIELKSISTTAPLCGTFRLSPEKCQLSPVEGKNKLSLDTGLITLSDDAKGTDFYFVVPAGYYNEGLIFNFVNNDNIYMQNIWYPKFELEAGKLYSFNEVPYDPFFKSIMNADDWNQFAKDINDGDTTSQFIFKDGTVYLGANISSDNLTTVTKEFPYVFDGKGYTITQSSATKSLFLDVSGEIKNLTLNGSLKLSDYGAPFVRQLRPGGKITDCTNNMNVTFTLTDKHVYVAGFAAVLASLKDSLDMVTKITNCTNNGSIIGTSTGKTTSGGKDAAYNVAIAGIVGDVRAGGSDCIPYNLVLENCDNTGKIELTPIPPADHTTIGMGLTGIGGVAGTLRSSKSVTMTDCDNSGNITLSAREMKTDKGMKAYSICMGGVIGCGTSTSGVGLALTGHDISITRCDNSGVLYNCGDNYSTSSTGNNKVYTGGIAGALVGLEDDYASLSSCTSTGNIITYDLVTGDQDVISARPAYCAVAGGLIGYGGYLDMKECTVNCQIGNGRRPMVAWGGMVGFLVKPFTLSNSRIHLNGYYQRLSNYKMNRAVIAVVPIKCGTKAEDVAGSKITGTLAVSGCLMSSGELSADDKSDLSSGLTTKVFADLTKVTNYLVYGEGYSAGVDYSTATITYTPQ